MRTIVVFVSDTHGGHRLGLLNPETVLYEEDETGNLKHWTPALTATQEYLWGAYLEDIGAVAFWRSTDWSTSGALNANQRAALYNKGQYDRFKM